MQQNLGLADEQIVRKINVADSDADATREAIKECIDEGCNIIFTTSWGYMETTAEMANEVLQAVEHLSDIAQDNLANTQNTYEQTEVVADTFKQVYNSADELKTIADELVKSIEYFKV